MSSREWYPNNQVFDLRDELKNIFYGDKTNPGIAQSVLIRRITDKRCVCWDGLQGSPEANCKYCRGEGFLWVETLNSVYVVRNFGGVLNPSSVISRQNFLSNSGYTDDNRALAYAEFDCFPNYERYLSPSHPTYDKLYELKVDANGGLIQPVIRTAKWKMRSVTPHRGDNGKVIYFEIGLESESV